MDLGCGKGGDIPKWRDAGIDYVMGDEEDEEELSRQEEERVEALLKKDMG